MGKKQLTRHEWKIEINLRAWKDPEFKKRLLENPKKTLKEMGCPFEFKVDKIKIVEEEEDNQVIVLRQPPKEMEALSPEDLKAFSAGGAVTDSYNRDKTCLGMPCGLPHHNR